MAHALDLSGSFTFDGQVVRYGRAGEGPAVVLVHGTPFSSFVWRKIAPILSEARSVYWYDLLGYGRSAMQDGQDVSLGVQNRLLAALLDHWGLARPDIVAHDFGGATALRAHLLDRCDYRSLALINSVAIAPWGSPFVQHVRRHEAAFAGVPPYVHAAIVGAYIRGAAATQLPADTLAAYAEPWLGDVGQAAFYRQIAQMDQRFTDEIAPLIGAVRCPTLILWGERDEWLPIERGRTLAGLIPGAIFRPIADAGHLVQEDAPEAVVAAIVGFPDGGTSRPG